VRSTKSQKGIGVINSASDGISTGIIPVSFESLHVQVAVGLAGCVGSEGGVAGSAGVVDNAAVCFARNTTIVVSVRRSVSAVDVESSDDRSLRVVKSASERVDGSVYEDIAEREGRTYGHALRIIVQDSSTHSRIARRSGTLCKRHIAVCFAVGSAEISTIR